MSMTNLAAGFVLRAKDQVSAVVGKVGRSFDRLQKRGAALRAGFSKIGQGLRGMATLGAGLGVVLGLSANKVAKFEEQVSVVESVLGRAAPGFDALKTKIKELGATTVFTATQAAEGAEFLSRAGFTANEQLAALAGTLDAAAAEAIPLGTAANIVANNVRAFGMDASEATVVADTLARTAAKTNTNMIQLGEALKFAAPEARALGIDVKDASFALGVLANAGLQGTIGGTAFKNMLIKLGRPTEAVKKKLNELNIEFQDTKGNMLPLVDVIKNIAKGTQKLEGNLNQAAFLTDFLGIRGKAAAQVLNTFANAGEEDFDKLVNSIRNADGAAKEMAEIRLDNLRGAMTLLGSAMEGLQIELWSGSLGGAADNVRKLADMISVVVVGLQQGEAAMNGSNDALAALEERLGGDMVQTLLAVSTGIREGLDVLGRLSKKVGEVAGRLGLVFGEQSSWAKFIAKFAVIAAPIVAVLSGLALITGLLVAPFIAFGSGILMVAKAIGVLSLGALAAATVFGGFFESTRSKGQEWKDHFFNTFRAAEFFIRDFFAGLWAGAESIVLAFFVIKSHASLLWDSLSPIFEQIGLTFGNASGSGESFGYTIASMVGRVVSRFLVLFKVVSFVARFFIDNFITPWVAGALQIVRGFINLITGATSFKTAFGQIFKGVGIMLVNFMLKPLQLTIDLLLRLGKAAGLSTKGAGMKGLEKINSGLKMEGLYQKKGEKVKNRRDGSVMDLTGGDNRKSLLDKLAEQMTKTTGKKTEANSPEINVSAGEVKADIGLDNKMCVDGKAMTVATSRTKIELAERMGRAQNPRQRQQIIANGDLPSESR